MRYVREVDIDVLEAFSEAAPASVVEAMRTTVANMLGTLPPAFFDVRVATVAENLAQVMFSVMMTGYMFRNAQYRVELSKSVVGVLPESQGRSRVQTTPGEPGESNPGSASAAAQSAYAPGAQKQGIEGDVLRWNLEHERAEAMSAEEYIHLLEAEVRATPRGRQRVLALACAKAPSL